MQLTRPFHSASVLILAAVLVLQPLNAVPMLTTTPPRSAESTVGNLAKALDAMKMGEKVEVMPKAWHSPRDVFDDEDEGQKNSGVPLKKLDDGDDDEDFDQEPIFTFSDDDEDENELDMDGVGSVGSEKGKYAKKVVNLPSIKVRNGLDKKTFDNTPEDDVDSYTSDEDDDEDQGFDFDEELLNQRTKSMPQPDMFPSVSALDRAFSADLASSNIGIYRPEQQPRLRHGRAISMPISTPNARQIRERLLRKKAEDDEFFPSRPTLPPQKLPLI